MRGKMPILVTGLRVPCPAIAVVSLPTPTPTALDWVQAVWPAGAAQRGQRSYIILSLGCVAQEPARPRQAGCTRRLSPLRAGDAAVLSAQGVLRLCKDERGRYAVYFLRITRYAAW